jgi:hypothetical protein
MAAPHRSSAEPVAGAAYAGVSLVAAVLLLPTNADPDLWGHLRYGLDILTQGTFAAGETYSFTADQPFLYHEWLGGVSMALAYRLAGVSGLIGLKLGILATALLVLARTLRAVPLQIQIAALLTVCWALLPISLTIRPQLWSVLAVVVVLTLLQRERGLWWLPVVMAAWANLHGGWIVGAGLVGLWSAYTVVVERNRVALGVLMATALATLVNPYGIGLWQFLGETVRLERADIQEWQPLWTVPLFVWGPWLIAVLTAVWACTRSDRPRADRLASLAVFACASLLVVRLVPFFVIMAVVYAAPSLGSLRSWRITAPSRTAARLLWVPVTVIAAVILMATPHPLRTGCLRIEGPWAPDLAVGAALQRARPVGRLAVPFNWGQYALWHMGPALKVSMDGRRETLYAPDTVRLQREVVRDSAEGREWILRTSPELVWMPLTAGRADWLRAHGYRIDIATPQSLLAVRSDQPPVAPSLPQAPCFPG